MTRGFAVMLTLLVLAAAIFTAWFSAQRRDYFPLALQSTYADCDVWHGIVERQAAIDEFGVEWFSGALSAFDEPSLSRRPAQSLRAVRLTWLRSFHDPIVVRIDAMPDGRQRLTAKQQPGGAGFGPMPGLARARERVRILTPDEATALDAILLTNRFFESPPSGCWGGVDGAEWILEGHDPSRGYQYRKRWAPEDGMEYDVGLFLLGLTGWDVEPVY